MTNASIMPPNVRKHDVSSSSLDNLQGYNIEFAHDDSHLKMMTRRPR